MVESDSLGCEEWELVKSKKPCKSRLLYVLGEDWLLPEIMIESVEETLFVKGIRPCVIDGKLVVRSKLCEAAKTEIVIPC